MKKLLIQSLLSLVLLFFASIVPLSSVSASTSKDAVCEGVGLTGGGVGCSAPSGSRSVNDVVELVINVLSVVVGFVAVIMIIISGLKYIISSGDSNNINSAKNTILYAIIGLVIVAMAQIIVRFILSKI